MNFSSFFEAVGEKKIEVNFDRPGADASLGLSNEALFHLPLLAITILAVASGRRKPKVDELGQIVGECFERTFVGFKGSSQHLGWSANLRVRTVRALSFLEVSGLVEVELPQKRISSTTTGKAVVAKAKRDDGDLAFTLHVLERSYRDISVERQISMEL